MGRRRRQPREPELVEVDSLSHDGRGVAHVDGKVVFIAGALPGERVQIQRVKRRRSHDEARLLEVLSAAPQRIEARCEYFGLCGGCALQHLSPADQIAAKQEVLLENLSRIGRVEPQTVLPPLQADSWGYRRRARLAVREVFGKGRVLVGFREKMAPMVADMHHCEVLSPPVGQLLDPLSELIGSLEISARLPQIEVAVAENVTALVLRVLDPPSAADRERLLQFAVTHDVQFYLQSGGLDTVEALDPAAADVPRYRLEQYDVELEFLPTDFVQVHALLNALMVAQALALLQPEDAGSVLDLYCGIGNFTLPLARLAKHVTGVEGDAGLVARARANLERNGLINASFHVADLSAECAAQDWAMQRYGGVLLDPPRTGAREVLPLFATWQPKRAVYVSCHPGTLARDAGILVHEHGYRLAAAGVMDMFPHTAHVESIALFEAPE